MLVNQPLPFHDQTRWTPPRRSRPPHARARTRPGSCTTRCSTTSRRSARADLEKYAGEVGLNVGQVQEGLGRPEDQGRGRRGPGARRLGRRQRHPDVLHQRPRARRARSRADAFETIIDDEIKKADELLKKGTPLKDVYDKRIEAGGARRRRPRRRRRPGGARGQAGHQAGRRARSRDRRPRRSPSSLFSDFQCPFCSRAVPMLKEIEDKYKGKVRIAFKHLPLPFHDKAHLAAEASLAANEQGKFWEYHDKLFANQQALDRPVAGEVRRGAGPQHGQVQGGARLRQVQGPGRRRRQGRRPRSAPPARPTFFVNGTKRGRRAAVRRVQDRSSTKS